MVFQSKYAWGGIKYSVSADTVGAVLEDIEQQNGTVSKELFLDASRSEDSPTHGMFEWDDSIAGEKWRLDQARKIICSLSLKIEHRGADVKDIGLTLLNRSNNGSGFCQHRTQIGCVRNGKVAVHQCFQGIVRPGNQRNCTEKRHAVAEGI